MSQGKMGEIPSGNREDRAIGVEIRPSLRKLQGVPAMRGESEEPPFSVEKRTWGTGIFIISKTMMNVTTYYVYYILF